jgi:hypothetical protein
MFCSSLALLFMFRGDSKVYIVRCHIPNLEICTDIDLLYGCRTKIQKGDKNAGYANHNPSRNLGVFRMLLSMVCNVSETQCANYS